MVPQDCVHDIVVDDERDDPHLATARRAQQRIHLVDTLDELRPAPAEGTGVRTLIPGGRSRGNMPAIGMCGADVGLVLPPPLSPRHIGVRPVVPDEVPPGFRDVHDDTGQKLGRVVDPLKRCQSPTYDVTSENRARNRITDLIHSGRLIGSAVSCTITALSAEAPPPKCLGQSDCVAISRILHTERQFRPVPATPNAFSRKKC